MKGLTKILFLCCFTFFGCSQAQTIEVDLWQGEIPNSIESSEYEEIKVFQDSVLTKTSQVTNPTLSIFLPEKPNGTAIVICPGGGYKHLAMHKEGYKVAEWLNTLGISAIVLKYRLPSDKIMKNKNVGPLQDAQEALRVVRRNAKKWHLNKDRIGVIGFSAGGHLAAALSTHYDENIYDALDSISARPNFSILIYPVISMRGEITHKGSQQNLLGLEPAESVINSFSNELQVNDKTPPTFLVHATDDRSVPVENSINYYVALKNNNVSVELHVYENGGHGFGLGVKETSQNWTKHCEQWLHLHHYID